MQYFVYNSAMFIVEFISLAGIAAPPAKPYLLQSFPGLHF